MMDIGKALIFIGAGLLLAGGVLFLLGKAAPGWKLPGDIYIKRENFSFYFPIATCILISIILSLALFFFKR